MEKYIIFGVTADVCCLIVCGIVILMMRMWGKALGKPGKFAGYVLLFHCIELTSNLFGLLFKGKAGQLVHQILIFTNFCEFASGYFLSYFMVRYIISNIERKDELKSWRITAIAILLVSVILLIISQFTGLYYIIDENNYYQRTAGFPISLISGIADVIIYIMVVFKYRSRFDSTEKAAIGVYITIPMAALVIQAFVYGIYIILLFNTVALTIMFLFMHYSQTRKYYNREQELVQMRVNIMISQMQPHFLYNSLAVIDQLCKTDPGKAREALSAFSTYLRCNMGSLKGENTIPFSEEIRHIKAYLTLEKMRFGELLNVNYDISCSEFMVPPLSVQPLVENAVKHGLGDKEDGGTITIKTEEWSDKYIITVTDDGDGFLPGETKGNGSHIGIENVRRRLSDMKCGELIIKSEPGKGTQASVVIYK